MEELLGQEMRIRQANKRYDKGDREKDKPRDI